MKKIERANIEISDTIISRVLAYHNEDENEYGVVTQFAGPDDEELVVEDTNGYPFSLKRNEVDAVIKGGQETFWF